MQRPRRVKKISMVDSSDSEEDIPLKKLRTSFTNSKKSPLNDKQTTSHHDSSSSESDIENYLQPANKIDLNSSFFNIQKKHEEFSKIEKDIFAEVTRLSDSDSDGGMEDAEIVSQTSKGLIKDVDNKPNTSTSGTKLNFQQLEDYTRKIEEAKKQIEEYNAKKKAEEHNLDISNLLAAGESKKLTLENIKPEDLHSSDFESCDSEQEDWEEVKTKESQETKEKQSIVPKDGLQITVDMPDTCRKKKGVDLLAAMKRRLNRIRKENQVYVHKVHLLCWIAHGNYVNQAINNTQTLGLALSLLPSDKCYPADRTDLGYLEQVVQWYKRTMKLGEKLVPKDMELVNAFQLQISKKEIYNKKMLVYIFIAILRALGIQCRLVLSFQVEPLRPPTSELHSLAKDASKKGVPEDKSKKATAKVKGKNSNSKDIGKRYVKNDSEKGRDKTEGIKKDKRDENKSKEPIKKEVNTQEKNKKVVSKKNKALEGTVTESNNKECKINVPTQKVKNNTNIKERGSRSKSKNPDKDETNSSKSSIKTEPKTGTKESSVGTSRLTVEKEKTVRSKSVNARPEKKFSQKSSNLLNVKESINRRSKSEEVSDKRETRSKTATKKDVIKIKLPKKNTKGTPQLDGINDSSDEDTFIYNIPQLDGADDNKNKKNCKGKKLNFKKLSSAAEVSCDKKNHPSRFKPAAEDYNSENEFRPRNPSTKKDNDSPKLSLSSKINMKKLKSPLENKNFHIGSSCKKQLDVKNDIINLIKGRIVEQKHIDRSRTVKKREPVSYGSDSDSDYMPEPIKKKHHDSDSDLDYFVPKPKVKQRISFRKIKEAQKVLSSDSDVDKSGKKKRKGVNVWAEVFLEAEEKWISVDVVHGQVHCVNELYTRATHPVCYVVAWNNDGSLKDITMRYCKNFNTVTRKLRIDAKWWEETLRPFRGRYTAKDKEEDNDLNRQQLDQPLPKTITEYKNHPLYALRRHLLKFEAIYPPDVQPLGYVRGEPVYPRNCVYICRSRDIWLKEARVVKPGEKPYKIVKARPKYDKLSNQIITDQLLEIFGEWQTMDYEPPTAANGIVPRNAFGNVELFKPCMLPKGTVHLKLSGLNKVCRRLNIDCASAIVGFDFHGGWSHPTYDGFVVCEEYADTVVAAWEVEQEEMERKEIEKIEKRVYGNWKKLIKGLLIRERLKAKYDFGNTSGEGGKEKRKSKGPTFCTKKRRIYSDSESESDNT